MSVDINTAPGVGLHTALDGVIHTDTVAQGPTKGSLVVANATPKWDELPVGANGTMPMGDSSQTLGIKYAHPALMAWALE